MAGQQTSLIRAAFCLLLVMVAGLSGCSAGAPQSRPAVVDTASPPDQPDARPATRPPQPPPPQPRHAAARPRTGPDGLPLVITHGPRDHRQIAITFDSNMTDAMLHRLDTGAVASYDDTAAVDELIRLRVPATFFLAGKWMLRYPGQTRRLAANPLFELASHSWSHDAFALPCYGLDPIPPAAMAADVRHSFAVLRRFTAHPTPYFRFPGGCYNTAALRAIAPTGVTVIQYDVASGDAFGTSTSAIVAHTLATATNGSIIVMHITLANAPLTPRALPLIVTGLRARGYTLVKLSNLLATA